MNTPKIVTDVITFLESKGHQCMMYNMSKQNLEWCCKDECLRTIALANMNKRNIKAYELADSLKKQGHNCIMYLESYPVKISWCNQETCIKK